MSSHNVLHVFFGDASYHPIVQSYLSFFHTHKYIDSPKDRNKLTRLKLLFKKLYEHKRYRGYIHCHDPISFSLSLLFFSRNKVILDAHEVFSTFINNKFIYKCAFLVEKLMLKFAKRKVFPSKDRAKIFFSNIENVKGLFIIENLLNDKLVPDILKRDKSPLKEKLLLELASVSDTIKCIYAGTFTDKRAIREIIEAIEQLNSSSNIEIKLYLFGETTDYLNDCLIGASDCIKYCGIVKREILLSIYSQFDLSFALYKPVDLNNKYCAPTKIFENEYFELKTVCNSSPYLQELSSTGRITSPILIDVLSKQSIVEGITSSLNNKIIKKNQSIKDMRTDARDKRILWSSQLDVIEKLYK